MLRKGPVQHRDVRVALKDLWMAADQVVVQQRQQLAGMIAADATHDGGDLIVTKCVMDVCDSGDRGAGCPSRSLCRVWHQPDAQTKRLEIRDASFCAMRKLANRPERRGDDGNGVSLAYSLGDKHRSIHRWLHRQRLSRRKASTHKSAQSTLEKS